MWYHGGDHGPQVVDGGELLIAFEALASAWHFDEARRVALIGAPNSVCYGFWVRRARAGQRVLLPTSLHDRIHRVLRVFTLLEAGFPDRGHAIEWLRTRRVPSHFNRRTPMTMLLDGTEASLSKVEKGVKELAAKRSLSGMSTAQWLGIISDTPSVRRGR